MAISGPMLIDITPYLSPDRVMFIDDDVDKNSCLARLAQLTATSPAIGEPETFFQALLEREQVSSTGIGDGIAVPHAKLASIHDFVMTVGISRSGIAFAAKDDQPVHIILMIGASESARDKYLRVLATVAGRLKNPEVQQQLRQALHAEAVIAALI